MRIRRRVGGREVNSSGGTGSGGAVQFSHGTRASGLRLRADSYAGQLVVAAEDHGQAFRATAFTSTPAEGEAPSPREPATASEWVQQNSSRFRRFAGRWVAVTNKGIVAASRDFDDVFAKAKQHGVANPLVFLVPKLGAGPKVVSTRLA